VSPLQNRAIGSAPIEAARAATEPSASSSGTAAPQLARHISAITGGDST